MSKATTGNPICFTSSSGVLTTGLPYATYSKSLMGQAKCVKYVRYSQVGHLPPSTS